MSHDTSLLNVERRLRVKQYESTCVGAGCRQWYRLGPRSACPRQHALARSARPGSAPPRRPKKTGRPAPGHKCQWTKTKTKTRRMGAWWPRCWNGWHLVGGEEEVIRRDSPRPQPARRRQRWQCVGPFGTALVRRLRPAESARPPAAAHPLVRRSSQARHSRPRPASRRGQPASSGPSGARRHGAGQGAVSASASSAHFDR